MAIEILREVLGWCAVMNYSLLLLWFLMYVLAHDWLYQLHGTWFTLSGENFAAILQYIVPGWPFSRWVYFCLIWHPISHYASRYDVRHVIHASALE